MALIRNIFLKTKISKTLMSKNGLCKIRQKFEISSPFFLSGLVHFLGINGVDVFF